MMVQPDNQTLEVVFQEDVEDRSFIIARNTTALLSLSYLRGGQILCWNLVPVKCWLISVSSCPPSWNSPLEQFVS